MNNTAQSKDCLRQHPIQSGWSVICQSHAYLHLQVGPTYTVHPRPFIPSYACRDRMKLPAPNQTGSHHPSCSGCRIFDSPLRLFDMPFWLIVAHSMVLTSTSPTRRDSSTTSTELGGLSMVLVCLSVLLGRCVSSAYRLNFCWLSWAVLAR